ncbi:MAG: pyrimidine/purine nucleoside phosphorylase, partial [Pseudomonadota bacterium]|nr:pyrimidine/purine nucleoside phosphorylase [Pseudomonadota bacterium]
MSDQFENVTVQKKANVYFDGKCVSYTVHFADGSKKTLGVIFPSSLRFTTGAAERMELLAGSCRVRVEGTT